MGYRSFEELEVWKRACRLAVRMYQVLSDCKERSLKDQMTSAAVSIASNVAEGAERGTRPDFSRFLNYSRGSAAELRTQLYIARRAGIIEVKESEQLIAELKEISSMLYALSSSIKDH